MKAAPEKFTFENLVFLNLTLYKLAPKKLTLFNSEFINNVPIKLPCSKPTYDNSDLENPTSKKCASPICVCAINESLKLVKEATNGNSESVLHEDIIEVMPPQTKLIRESHSSDKDDYVSFDDEELLDGQDIQDQEEEVWRFGQEKELNVFILE